MLIPFLLTVLFGEPKCLIKVHSGEHYHYNTHLANEVFDNIPNVFLFCIDKDARDITLDGSDK